MMRKITMMTLATLAAVGLAACGGDDKNTTTGGDLPEKGITVTDPWARTTAPTATTGAVYMTIASTDGDVLTAVSVPASVAGEAQMHEATTGANSGHDPGDAGTMGHDPGDTAPMTAMKGMRRVHRIEIAAGRSVHLAPGGYHIMLMRLAAPVTAGQKIPITLTFSKAGEVTVDAVARDR